MMTKALLTVIGTWILLQPTLTVAQAGPALPESEGNALSLASSAYTCEQAEKIRFNKQEFYALEFTQRQIVGAIAEACITPPEADYQPVLVVNPAATSDQEKVFYGTVKKKQLAEARKACATAGGVAAVTLTVAGSISGNAAAGDIGAALFQYSEVSCTALAGEVAKGNLVAVLGPQQVVASAVATKMGQEFVSRLPLLSNADKKKVKEAIATTAATPVISVGKNITVKAAGITVSARNPIKWP